MPKSFDISLTFIYFIKCFRTGPLMLRKYWKLDSAGDETLITGSHLIGQYYAWVLIPWLFASLGHQQIWYHQEFQVAVSLQAHFLDVGTYLCLPPPTTSPPPTLTLTPEKKIFLVRKSIYQRIIIWLWLQVKSEDMSLNVVQGNACWRGSFLWVINSYNSYVKINKICTSWSFHYWLISIISQSVMLLAMGQYV